jgi:8-oxo-dGTP pyrophosphatase MutT (NUDIX family)
MFISQGTRSRIADRVRRMFGGMPAHVQAAALPWRRAGGGVEVLLVTSRGTGRWVLPKGWPEGSEHLSEAARREALEEAGVRGAVSPVEAGRYFYGKHLPSGMQKRCEVHVFPLEVAAVEEDWPEKGARERHWFPTTEAAQLVGEPDLAEMIAGFLQKTREN